MGGLALKHLEVQRIDAYSYYELSCKIKVLFSKLFNHVPLIVPAYASKFDFGDCDMIVSTSELPTSWRETLAESTSSKGWLCNGDVTSMEIEGTQFDFISVPFDKRELAFVYFAFNDLGNLMGRIAHKMGFKYGHQGLQKALKQDNNVYAVIEVTNNIAEIFDFMGYDYLLHTRGFETLNDIFEFVATSKWFSPDIYLLHNRNSVSRIRDAKRKTYMEFLLWCENSICKYNWATDTDGILFEKQTHLSRACLMWPDFAKRVDEAKEIQRQNLELKSRWNGKLVHAWTGLTEKALGEFMYLVRNHPHFTRYAHDAESLRLFAINLYDSRS